MGTFNGTYGSEAMFSAISQEIDRRWSHLDVHTVTLTLNGQHGEFDLTVEATDESLEDVRVDGIAFRNGGVHLPNPPAPPRFPQW